jgi:hypothetical protein
MFKEFLGTIRATWASCVQFDFLVWEVGKY